MNDDDRRAFEDAMRGVKPIRHDERATAKERPKPAARRARREYRALLEESLRGDAQSLEQLGEEAAYRRPGVTAQTFRKLRRGRYAIEAEIDLHGLTAGDARVALREFIVDSTAQGLGCVRVVHGKGLGSGPGGPVLKQRVQIWLSQWDEVLAFVSAQLRHGGGGAIYVLLGRGSINARPNR